MAKDSAGRRVKIGVRHGGGPPPGYRWDVVIFDRAFEEARAFLNEDQYGYLAYHR